MHELYVHFLSCKSVWKESVLVIRVQCEAYSSMLWQLDPSYHDPTIVCTKETAFQRPRRIVRMENKQAATGRVGGRAGRGSDVAASVGRPRNYWQIRPKVGDSTWYRYIFIWSPIYL